MQGIDWNVWAVVIATMLTGIIVAVAIYFTTKNLSMALVQGIGIVVGSLPTMNALEQAYTNVMPDEWEPAVSALIEALQRQAEGTASEADDALLDFLDKATDGLPNDGSAKIVAG